MARMHIHSCPTVFGDYVRDDVGVEKARQEFLARERGLEELLTPEGMQLLLEAEEEFERRVFGLPKRETEAEDAG